MVGVTRWQKVRVQNVMDADDGFDGEIVCVDTKEIILRIDGSNTLVGFDAESLVSLTGAYFIQP